MDNLYVLSFQSASDDEGHTRKQAGKVFIKKKKPRGIFFVFVSAVISKRQT
jgi:hypothetical protein